MSGEDKHAAHRVHCAGRADAPRSATAVSRCRGERRIACRGGRAGAGASRGLPRGIRLGLPVAMRMLWLLGCVVSASTAYAQPGATADAPPVPPAGAPPTAAPVPMPGAPPGLTPPCAPTTVCVPQDALGPATTPALALQAEPEGSYRWQVFAADGASLALLVSGSKTGATVGAVGY